MIGEFSTSLAELMAAHGSHKKLEWECINAEKAKKKKKYKNSGTVSAEVKVGLPLSHHSFPLSFLSFSLV